MKDAGEGREITVRHTVTPFSKCQPQSGQEALNTTQMSVGGPTQVKLNYLLPALAPAAACVCVCVLVAVQSQKYIHTAMHNSQTRHRKTKKDAHTHTHTLSRDDSWVSLLSDQYPAAYICLFSIKHKQNICYKMTPKPQTHTLARARTTHTQRESKSKQAIDLQGEIRYSDKVFLDFPM